VPLGTGPPSRWVSSVGGWPSQRWLIVECGSVGSSSTQLGTLLGGLSAHNYLVLILERGGVGSSVQLVACPREMHGCAGPPARGMHRMHMYGKGPGPMAMMETVMVL
jgi:hypothetical protein